MSKREWQPGIRTSSGFYLTYMPRASDDKDDDGGGNGDEAMSPVIHWALISEGMWILASCQLMPDSFLKDAYLI